MKARLNLKIIEVQPILISFYFAINDEFFSYQELSAPIQ